MKNLSDFINEAKANEAKYNTIDRTRVKLEAGQKKFGVFVYHENGYQSASTNDEKTKGFDKLEDAKKWGISKCFDKTDWFMIKDNTIWSGSNELWKHTGTAIAHWSNFGKKETTFITNQTKIAEPTNESNSYGHTGLNRNTLTTILDIANSYEEIPSNVSDSNYDSAEILIKLLKSDYIPKKNHEDFDKKLKLFKII